MVQNANFPTVLARHWTGNEAMISAGIALDHSALDIVDFYLRDVPRGFRPRRFAVQFVQDVSDDDLMEGLFEACSQGAVTRSLE